MITGEVVCRCRCGAVVDMASGTLTLKRGRRPDGRLGIAIVGCPACDQAPDVISSNDHHGNHEFYEDDEPCVFCGYRMKEATS